MLYSLHSSRRGTRVLNITVRLFAGYRDRVGQDRLTLYLAGGATVGDLAGEIARRYPRLTRDPRALVVAVNDEYRDHLFPLGDGDEVALIPPVSGGAVQVLESTSRTAP